MGGDEHDPIRTIHQQKRKNRKPKQCQNILRNIPPNRPNTNTPRTIKTKRIRTKHMQRLDIPLRLQTTKTRHNTSKGTRKTRSHQKNQHDHSTTTSQDSRTTHRITPKHNNRHNQKTITTRKPTHRQPHPNTTTPRRPRKQQIMDTTTRGTTTNTTLR